MTTHIDTIQHTHIDTSTLSIIPALYHSYFAEQCGKSTRNTNTNNTGYLVAVIMSQSIALIGLQVAGSTFITGGDSTPAALITACYELTSLKPVSTCHNR